MIKQISAIRISFSFHTKFLDKSLASSTYVRILSGVIWRLIPDWIDKEERAAERNSTTATLEERTNAFCPRGRVGEEVYHTLYAVFFRTFFLEVSLFGWIDWLWRTATGAEQLPRLGFGAKRHYLHYFFSSQTSRDWISDQRDHYLG